MSFYLKTRAIDSGAATIGILRSFRLFKEVLWVSVGQLAAKLQAVKVGCLKKILPPGPPQTTRVQPAFDYESFSNFDSL